MKKIQINIFVFLIILVVFCTISAYAGTVIAGSNITYNNNSLSSKTNVQDAIDDLYDKASYGDATANDILVNKTAMVGGKKVSGLISSIEAKTITPTTVDQTIEAGKYLSGTQTILGDANLVAENIKSGTSIFGVTGTYTGTAEKPKLLFFGGQSGGYSTSQLPIGNALYIDSNYLSSSSNVLTFKKACTVTVVTFARGKESSNASGKYPYVYITKNGTTVKSGSNTTAAKTITYTATLASGDVLKFLWKLPSTSDDWMYAISYTAIYLS